MTGSGEGRQTQPIQSEGNVEATATTDADTAQQTTVSRAPTVVERIRERFPEAIEDTTNFRGQLTIRIRNQDIRAVCRFLAAAGRGRFAARFPASYSAHRVIRGSVVEPRPAQARSDRA